MTLKPLYMIIFRLFLTLINSISADLIINVLCMFVNKTNPHILPLVFMTKSYNMAIANACFNIVSLFFFLNTRHNQ